MKDTYSNEKYPSVIGVAVIAFFIMFALSGCGLKGNLPVQQGAIVGGALAPSWITDPSPRLRTLDRGAMKTLRLTLAEAAKDANAIAQESNKRRVNRLLPLLSEKLSVVSDIVRNYKLTPNATADQDLFWEMLDTRADVLTESMGVYGVCLNSKPINWKEIKSIALYQAIELKEMDRFCGLVEGCLQ